MGAYDDDGFAPGPGDGSEALMPRYGPYGEISGERMLSDRVEGIPCLLEPILQQVGIAAVVGSSDTGKSAFLRELAAAVSAGAERFAGFRINARHRRAVYVSTEDDERSIAYLLGLQNCRWNYPAQALAGLDYLFETDNLTARLDRKLAATPADLVIVDAFADIYPGSMNENNRVRAFLQEFNQLAQRHQCLVLFLHHTGKRTEDLAPSKHNAIGSQGFEAKMRLVIELRNDMLDPSRKHLCIVKGNYLPPEFKQESFVLEFTESMTFSNTGNRVPFEDLRRGDPERGDNPSPEKRAVYERLMALRREGKTFAEIAQICGYKSHTTVKRIIERYRDYGEQE